MTVSHTRFRGRFSLAVATLALPLLLHSAEVSHDHDHDHGGCDAGFHGPPPGGPVGMGHGPMGIGPGEDVPPFLRDVKLTEDQQDKVFAITHAAAPALHDQYKALRKAHDALREFGRSPQFSVDTATSLAQAQGKAEGQLTLLRVRLEHDVYAVLTPEQRAQVTDHEHTMDAHPRGTPL